MNGFDRVSTGTEFNKAFEQLNTLQKEAVETINGPLLVIAGPGTGKTQLLSTRVGYILKNTDAAPQNILCLTFTNKAAINMSERIIDLAGQEGARVNVKTFHGFASEIMNSYPDYFWNSAKLSVAPESVQLDTVEQIVKSLPLDNPLALKFAGQFTLLSDIQRSINLAKDAGLTPEKLAGLIKVNLSYIDLIEEQMIEICSERLNAKKLDDLIAKVDDLPDQGLEKGFEPLTSLSQIIKDSLKIAVSLDLETSKTGNTGAWKKRWVQTEAGAKGMFSERRKNQWWLELAAVYKQYKEAMHLRGFYDYADMLVETITQLEQNSSMLADVQERFSYVLIDEFQDTNPAQLRMAHLVADHHASGGAPNLMAVGDDDQSIYKFNGAELNNMLGFKRSYPGAKIIILTDSYRSSQAVLDVAKKVVEQATTRLTTSDKALNKELVAKNPPKRSGKIRAISYPSRELQLSEIARDIKTNYSTNTQIAILARGHDSLKRMAGLLQHLKVPVRYEQASNVLDHEIVEQIGLVLQLITGIQNGNKTNVSSLIPQIVKSKTWGLDAKELWQLALKNYPRGNWLDVMITSQSKKLSTLGQWFIELAAETGSQPLAVTIEQIIGLRPTGDFTSPIRQYYLGKKDDTNKYFHALSAIQLLRSLVHEFGEGEQPTVGDFVRFIKLNKDNGKVVADESPFITGDHAVQLLSVHKAKGLEFDQVYIIDAIEDNWQPNRGSRKPPANLPLQPNGDDFDDYVRLMYVAITRAKSSITISAYHFDHAGKDVALSSIILSAFDVKRLSENDKQKLIEILEENLRWPELAEGLEKQMLQGRLEEYSLPVTHLLNFLDVTKGGPLYFKERHLLRLPEAKTSSLAFGTAMHTGLEMAGRLTNKNEFDIDQVIKQFKKALINEQLPEIETQRLLTKGSKTLERLFGQLDYKIPLGSLVEQYIKDVKLETARIQGKLDRVDSVHGKLKIIDYKTGAPLSSFYTKDKNKAIKAYKQKLQLIFYALLANRSKAIKIGDIESEMVYVEAEQSKDLARSYTPTDEDIKRLISLIEAVWKKITNLDLPDTSGYSQDIDGILKFEQDLLK